MKNRAEIIPPFAASQNFLPHLAWVSRDRLDRVADGADAPDGMSVPEELARREDRLARIAEAKAVIEARAEKAKKTGRKPGGRPPEPSVAGPGPKDQVNLTDADSRIMPVAGGGFEQAYNAQALVAADSLLVVTNDVVQAPNDKRQIEPALEALSETGRVPKRGKAYSRSVESHCAACFALRQLDRCRVITVRAASSKVGTSDLRL